MPVHLYSAGILQTEHNEVEGNLEKPESNSVGLNNQKHLERAMSELCIIQSGDGKGERVY